MPTVNINSTVSGGSVSATTLVARTPDSVTGSEPAIPAGKGRFVKNFLGSSMSHGIGPEGRSRAGRFRRMERP